MAKGNKRKPDLRKIRPTKVYRPAEVARDLNRNTRTINAWIKDGLPILSQTGPVLIEGAVLKTWLKNRHASKKQKCLPNEFCCFKCRKPRTAKYGSISFHAQNPKTLKIKALCRSCGTRLNKAAKFADLSQLQAVYQQIQPDNPHLEGCNNLSLNSQYFEQPTAQSGKATRGGQKLTNEGVMSGSNTY